MDEGRSLPFCGEGRPFSVSGEGGMVMPDTESSRFLFASLLYVYKIGGGLE